MPLAGVESYINEHKHLPDVPSANEVEKNGVSVGQTEALLLQKTEELTLYLIEMNKRLELLEQENKALKEKLENFENK